MNIFTESNRSRGRLFFSIGCFILSLLFLFWPNPPKARSKPLSGSAWALVKVGGFFKYASAEQAGSLIYDVGPQLQDREDGKPADAMPTLREDVKVERFVLKPWIFPTGNDFIKDPTRRFRRPEGNPGHDFPFVQRNFDDRAWEEVNLPHDWTIQGPFFTGPDAPVGGGMGRLPSPGLTWYRKKIYIPISDGGKSIFLEIEDAMSYAMVWLNGHLVGGWPYGYASCPWISRLTFSWVKKISWPSVWTIPLLPPAGIPAVGSIEMWGWSRHILFMWPNEGLI